MKTKEEKSSKHGWCNVQLPCTFCINRERDTFKSYECSSLWWTHATVLRAERNLGNNGRNAEREYNREKNTHRKRSLRLATLFTIHILLFFRFSYSMRRVSLWPSLRRALGSRRRRPAGIHQSASALLTRHHPHLWEGWGCHDQHSAGWCLC